MHKRCDRVCEAREVIGCLSLLSGRLHEILTTVDRISDGDLDLPLLVSRIGTLAWCGEDQHPCRFLHTPTITMAQHAHTFFCQ